MISTDADIALRSNDGHLYLLRGSARNRGPNERPINDGVGSIQVIALPSGATSRPINKSDPLTYDDGLSAARGMLLGVVLGVGFWALVASFVGMMIF